VKFVDHGRLANARRARYQHKLRPAMSYDTVKASSRVAISRSRPWSLSGMISRSAASCAPSGNSSMRPVASHAARHIRRSASTPRGSLVALLRSLREELHHHRRELGGSSSRRHARHKTIRRPPTKSEIYPDTRRSANRAFYLAPSTGSPSFTCGTRRGLFSNPPEIVEFCARRGHF
jgi:hypothetical protein